MRRAIFTLVLSAAITAPAAFAQDYSSTDNTGQSAGTSDTTISPDDSGVSGQAPGTATEGRTETEVGTATQGIFASPFTVSPRIGALGYGAADGSYTSRITEGFTLDWLVPNITDPASKIAAGVELGFLYSHLGSPNATFLGTNSSGPGGGTNTFTVPAEIAVGYKMSDTMLTSLLLGTNMIYRSDKTQMLLGRGDASGGSGVDFFPSVGLNMGWALGKSAALSVRGDYVPTPLQDVFTATIGATFPLA